MCGQVAGWRWSTANLAVILPLRDAVLADFVVSPPESGQRTRRVRTVSMVTLGGVLRTMSGDRLSGEIRKSANNSHQLVVAMFKLAIRSDTIRS